MDALCYCKYLTKIIVIKIFMLKYIKNLYCSPIQIQSVYMMLWKKMSHVNDTKDKYSRFFVTLHLYNFIIFLVDF